MSDAPALPETPSETPLPAARPARGLAMVNMIASMSWRDLMREHRVHWAMAITVGAFVGALLLLARDVASVCAGCGFDPAMDLAAYVVIATATPLVALLLAGAIAEDEIMEGTFAYLLVRPLERGRLWLARLVPVMTLGLGLAALQGLFYVLGRWIAWLAVGGETNGVSGDVAVWSAAPALMGAAMFQMAYLLLLFSFIGMVWHQWRFVGAFLVLVVYELPLAFIGSWTTGTFHALSILDASQATWEPAAPLLASLAIMAAAIVGLTLLSVARMRRRAFVTAQ